jgi:hypothetical protein
MRRRTELMFQVVREKRILEGCLAKGGCRHPEVRALARLEGWATSVDGILRGSPKTARTSG